ncbi:MAG: hypothetical protein ACE369_19070 [Roseovarius sp.]
MSPNSGLPEMVIHAAVAPASIIGAVYGTLLVNYAKTTFSESFPNGFVWALFIGRDGFPTLPV